LRRKWGYQGTVFSDDLVMQAALIAGKLADRLAASLQAGCDAALVCDPESARELLRQLGDGVSDATTALSRLRGHCQHTAAEIETVSEWRHWKQSIRDLENSKWA
jgi:beta-N-acetylhexosaminidase